MGMANFSAARTALTPAHRALVREREPIGREKFGRERSTVERPTKATKPGIQSEWTVLEKRPQVLGRHKFDRIPWREETATEARGIKQSRPEVSATAVPFLEALTKRIEARYASGDAVSADNRASMEYQFPRLPVDTAERQARYYRGEAVSPEVAFVHGYEGRPLLHGWRPFYDPFSRGANAPRPVLDEEPPLLNPGLGSGPFYGRYVGPASPRGNLGPPLTPVDRAAYIHDAEYYEIYDRYQYSEFEYGLSFSNSIGLGGNPAAVQYFGWAGNATSLDPAMQLELAWADVKLIGGSWYNIGEGLSDNFYSGGVGQRALVTDLAWAGAITVLYSQILVWRLGMAAVGLGFQLMRGFAGTLKSLGGYVGGDVGKAIGWIGDAANWVLDIAARVVSIGAMAQFTYNVILAGAGAAIVGGVIYIGGKVIEGVGKAVEWVGDRIGCFITEAVMRTSRERDDGPTLSVLRRFRDEYVASQPEGRRLLLTYLEIAPAIVSAIDRRNDSKVIWREIRERWIDPAVLSIRHDSKERALTLYIEMVEELAHRFGVPAQYDGSRSHWKRDPRLAIR